MPTRQWLNTCPTRTSAFRKLPAPSRIGIFFLLTVALLSPACAPTRSAPWPPPTATNTAEGQQVTVVIALSSLIAGGIVGHCGLAVGEAYWDFGPTRSDSDQRLQSIHSPAGPWWDDPDQQGVINHSLAEVFDDLPNQVHPLGSIIALIQVQVTDDQAQAITHFWHETYRRMQQGEETYALARRQCANMVAWSLKVGLDDAYPLTEQLPREFKMMSPTKLYEQLRDSLVHTAGPTQGQRADLTLWQLGPHGIEPWQRPAALDDLRIPQLPRMRLACERIKHLPHAWRD